MVVYHRAVDAVDAVTHIDRDGFLFFGLGEWAQGGVSFAGVFYGLNMTAVVVYACHTQMSFLAQVERIEHDLRNFSLGREFCRSTVGYGCLRG